MNASDLYTNALTVSDDMCAICRYLSEEACDSCPVRKTLEDLRDEYDTEQATLETSC